MNISFYTFGKKANSTKKPIGIAGKFYDCNFLDSTDVIHPSIALVVSEKPTAFNYAYIQDLRRYYFIDSWEFVGGRWVARMTVDALASWKIEIGNQNMYIERSSSMYDPSITDYQYPAIGKPNIHQDEILTGWFPTLSNGSYILGVRSGFSGIGSTTYYVLTVEDMWTLQNVLFNDTGWLNISDISSDLQKALFDPMQYIVSCVWLPFNVDPQYMSADGGSIKFGWWNLTGGAFINPETGVTTSRTFHCKRLVSPCKVDFYSPGSSVPHHFVYHFIDHPQAATRGVYLNNAPYSKYILYLPRFGDIEIDSVYCTGGKYVACDFIYDLTNGDAICDLWSYLEETNEKWRHITTLTARVGCDVSVSSNMANIGGVASSVGGIVSATTGMVGSVIKGGFSSIVSSVGNTISSIGNAIDTPVQRTNSATSNGSFAWNRLQFAYAKSLHYLIAEEDNGHFGRPLCAKHTINELSGFVKCTDSDIDIPCLDAEKTMISAHMVGGFFYE